VTRFVVLGAGAVGGVVGGRLAEHGHDVVLVARGEHYQALRDRGLHLASWQGDVDLDVVVVDDLRRIEWSDDDVVLLAVKSQHTVAALDALSGAAGPTVPVVCVQNGVVNERMALRRFDDVYGVCVMCPTSHLEPGVVEALSAPLTGMLDIGSVSGGDGVVARRVSAALESSTFESVLRTDIMRWKYGKLIMNLVNGVEVVCDPTTETGALAAALRSEGTAVLDAAHLPYVGNEEDAARRAGKLVRDPSLGADANRRASTWQSVARGTGTVEADYLNGEIVVLGRLHGVPTPLNARLQRLCNEVARGIRRAQSLTEADVLALPTPAGS
jgi:2-dehydropantoate 2-reductase